MQKRFINAFLASIEIEAMDFYIADSSYFKMRIKEVYGRKIEDSRKERTIEIFIKTETGVYSASSPSGKSKGRNEAPSFIRDIDLDMQMLKDLKMDFSIDCFEDLEKVEKIVKGKIGANSIFALESAILKARAFERKKEIWELVNEKARKLPHPVGNCIGGGMHTPLFNGKKPDFQEFLVIPKARKFIDSVFLMKKMQENAGKSLKIKRALGRLNDENAWATSLENEQVLNVMNNERDKLEAESSEKIEIGIDAASSSFYTGLYNYKNPRKCLTADKQTDYMQELTENYDIYYLEDPMQEEDFSGFAKLREGVKGRCLIVGDDLITSNVERFLKAVYANSISAVILKPNQCGSLIGIKKIVQYAKKYDIATIMSHRSGETNESIIADLAFGFSCDFIKTGIIGKEREAKLSRMIEIEREMS